MGDNKGLSNASSQLIAASRRTAMTHDRRAVTNHNSIIFEDVDTIKQFLLEGSINLLSIDENGKTPLHVAVACDNIEKVHLLLTGSSINASDNNGLTAIHWACIMGNPSIVRVLLEKSGTTIDLNAKDKKGNTPLDYAIVSIKNGREEICEMLRQRNAKESSQVKCEPTHIENSKELKELLHLLKKNKDKTPSTVSEVELEDGTFVTKNSCPTATMRYNPDKKTQDEAAKIKKNSYPRFDYHQNDNTTAGQSSEKNERQGMTHHQHK